jgi:hypothetical protein
MLGPPTFVPLTLLRVAFNLCASLSQVRRMSASPLSRSAFWGALKKMVRRALLHVLSEKGLRNGEVTSFQR